MERCTEPPHPLQTEWRHKLPEEIRQWCGGWESNPLGTVFHVLFTHHTTDCLDLLAPHRKCVAFVFLIWIPYLVCTIILVAATRPDCIAPLRLRFSTSSPRREVFIPYCWLMTKFIDHVSYPHKRMQRHSRCMKVSEPSYTVKCP